MLTLWLCYKKKTNPPPLNHYSQKTFSHAPQQSMQMSHAALLLFHVLQPWLPFIYESWLDNSSGKSNKWNLKKKFEQIKNKRKHQQVRHFLFCRFFKKNLSKHYWDIFLMFVEHAGLFFYSSFIFNRTTSGSRSGKHTESIHWQEKVLQCPIGGWKSIECE